MTPVSFAPATPAVRGADTPVRAPKNDAGDKFESLLAQAADAQPDDRDNAIGKKDSKELPKDQRMPARSQGRKKTAVSDEGDAEKPVLTSETAQPAKTSSEQAVDVESLVASAGNSLATQNDAISPETAPVTTPVVIHESPAGTAAARSAHDGALGNGALAVATEIITPGNSSMPAVPPAAKAADSVREIADTQASGCAPGKTNGQTPEKAPAPAIGKIASPQTEDASVDPIVEAASDNPIFQAAGKADASTAPQAAPLPANVKSASWMAAASALRQALQKSAVAVSDSHTVPQQAPTAAAAKALENAIDGASFASAASVVVPTVRSAQSDRKLAESMHSNADGASLGDAAMGTLIAATATGSRQQSSDSNPDLGNGSSAGYKAPLKNGAAVLSFVAPAAFARALETAAPPATPSLPPSFSSSHLSTVGPQLVKGLQMQVTAGGGDMRLTLTPEHLGTVSIEVRVEQDRVKATLMADTPAVRQWIATHQDDLRQRLDAAGLKLDDLVVKEDGRQSQQERQEERPAAPRRRTPRTDGEREVFEVVA